MKNDPEIVTSSVWATRDCSKLYKQLFGASGLPSPEIIQNSTTTNKLQHVSGLGPIVPNDTKKTFWSLQTTPSKGFGIGSLSKRHLPQGLVFPGLSKRHPPRLLGLLGLYIRRTSRPCLPSLSKRHPPRGSGPFSKWVQNRAKKYLTWRRGHFFL